MQFPSVVVGGGGGCLLFLTSDSGLKTSSSAGLKESCHFTSGPGAESSAFPLRSDDNWNRRKTGEIAGFHMTSCCAAVRRLKLPQINLSLGISTQTLPGHLADVESVIGGKWPRLLP